tara:strand:+ start:32712 stop:32999 length:288 start_codon:yes stop_codon:yes gene_type:complete
MRPRHENGNGASPQNPEVLALRALAWTVSDNDRAQRLLALTGLDAGQLRQGADNPLILGATLDFLAGHEPDLLACADALGVLPGQLIAAAQGLAR